MSKSEASPIENHHFQSMATQLDDCDLKLRDLLNIQSELIENLRIRNETFSRRPEITRIHGVMSKIPKYLKKIEKLRRDMKEVDGKMRWTKATCVRAWQKHQKTMEQEKKKRTPVKKKKKKVVAVEAPASNTTQITPSIKKAQSVECIKVVKKTKKKKKKRRVVLED
eukprot:g24.t1